MSTKDEWFAVSVTYWSDSWTGRGPPVEVRNTGGDPGDAQEFASALFGAVAGIRAVESAGGNGESIGGGDLAETAARFLVLVAERELEGGFWHFLGGDAGAEEEGYGPGLAALRAMGAAAREFLRVRGPRPPPHGD